MLLSTRRSTTSIKLFGWIRAVTRGMQTIDEMKKLLPATMISQAYIFAKDKKHVWTFSSYDAERLSFLIVTVFLDLLLLRWKELFRNFFWFGCKR